MCKDASVKGDQVAPPAAAKAAAKPPAEPASPPAVQAKPAAERSPQMALAPKKRIDDAKFQRVESQCRAILNASTSRTAAAASDVLQVFSDALSQLHEMVPPPFSAGVAVARKIVDLALVVSVNHAECRRLAARVARLNASICKLVNSEYSDATVEGVVKSFDSALKLLRQFSPDGYEDMTKKSFWTRVKNFYKVYVSNAEEEFHRVHRQLTQALNDCNFSMQVDARDRDAPSLEDIRQTVRAEVSAVLQEVRRAESESGHKLAEVERALSALVSKMPAQGGAVPVEDGDEDSNSTSIREINPQLVEIQWNHVLGSGATGTVYAAVYASTIPVAVKDVSAMYDSSAAAAVCGNDSALPAEHSSKVQDASQTLLINEVRQLLKLRHPNVIRVYGIVNLSPTARMLVMERLGCELRPSGNAPSSDNNSNLTPSRDSSFASDSSSPLASLSSPTFGLTLDNEQKMKYLQDVILGMAYVHSKLIVHRDLKPANILLSLNRHCAKVIDFGISASRGTVTSGEGLQGARKRAKGTLPYMAPEVFESKVWMSSDVYAFGVTCYEVWGEQWAWKHLRDDQIYELVRRGCKPCSLSDMVQKRKFPLTIAVLIDACWCFTPHDRPTFEVLASTVAKRENFHSLGDDPQRWPPFLQEHYYRVLSADSGDTPLLLDSSGYAALPGSPQHSLPSFHNGLGKAGSDVRGGAAGNPVTSIDPYLLSLSAAELARVVGEHWGLVESSVHLQTKNCAGTSLRYLDALKHDMIDVHISRVEVEQFAERVLTSSTPNSKREVRAFFCDAACQNAVECMTRERDTEAAAWRRLIDLFDAELDVARAPRTLSAAESARLLSEDAQRREQLENQEGIQRLGLRRYELRTAHQILGPALRGRARDLVGHWRLVEKEVLPHDFVRLTFAFPYPQQQLGLAPGQFLTFSAVLQQLPPKGTDGAAVAGAKGAAAAAVVPQHALSAQQKLAAAAALEKQPQPQRFIRYYVPVSPLDTLGRAVFIVKVFRPNMHPQHPAGGVLSQYLANLSVGSTIDVCGPYGRYSYRGDGVFDVARPVAAAPPAQPDVGEELRVRNIGLIATGTNMTVMRQIVYAIVNGPDEPLSVHVLYAGFFDFDCEWFRDELEQTVRASEAKYPNKTFRLHFTTEKCREGWNGFQGRVTEAMLKSTMPRSDADGGSVVLLCAPKVMIDMILRPVLVSALKYRPERVVNILE